MVKTVYQNSSRRVFLKTLGSAGMAASVSGLPVFATAQASSATPLKICVFSKHLQWLDWSALGETAAEIGFEGVDLTVRQGGHIAPERAEQDLPRAVAAIRQAGLELPMVTAGIIDDRTPYAEAMLRAFQASGITRYRWGGLRYVTGRPLPDQLTELQQVAARLAALNRKYKVCAMYHTHSGLEVGASIWDLWVLLKDLDRTALGVNYDVAHATVEGGLGGWQHSSSLIAPWMKGVAIKDFTWARNSRGEWRPQWCPLGEGMVNFKRFFTFLKEANFSGPLQVHYEYPLGGAEHGARTLTVPRDQVIAAMRRDLTVLRGWLREAGLA